MPWPWVIGNGRWHCCGSAGTQWAGTPSSSSNRCGTIRRFRSCTGRTGEPRMTLKLWITRIPRPSPITADPGAHCFSRHESRGSADVAESDVVSARLLRRVAARKGRGRARASAHRETRGGRPLAVARTKRGAHEGTAPDSLTAVALMIFDDYPEGATPKLNNCALLECHPEPVHTRRMPSGDQGIALVARAE